MASVYGGYEYEFVDTVAPKYHCGICLKVLRDARLTACCGQHYCDSCLLRWLWGRNICPHCRKTNFQSIINLEKMREIKEMCIHCTNYEKGCQWVGELGCIKQHLELDTGCGFVGVKCTAFGYRKDIPCYSVQIIDWSDSDEEYVVKRSCGMVIERQYLAEHQRNEWEYRQYTCEYCGYVDTYDAIAGTASVRNRDSVVGKVGNHYTECDNIPVACPNECGVNSLKRKEMKIHRDTCPLELIECPYGACATSGNLLRKDVEKHKEVCDYRPYTCEYCNFGGTYLSITGTGKLSFMLFDDECHYDICDYYPLECPNKCGASLQRKDMLIHQNTCPLKPTDCLFKNIGCAVKMTYQDMDSHLKMSMQQHLVMMAKSHERLAHKIEELSEKNEKLAQNNKELAQKVEDVTRRSEAMAHQKKCLAHKHTVPARQGESFSEFRSCIEKALGKTLEEVIQ